MQINDYDVVHRLWESTPGVGVNDSDSLQSLTLFLTRNPSLSLVVLSPTKQIVGTVLCGHDGRRGYLHHLVVTETSRGLGLGRELVETCLTELRKLSILKTNIYLFTENIAGREFWLHEGWALREDLIVMQRGSSGC